MAQVYAINTGDKERMRILLEPKVQRGGGRQPKDVTYGGGAEAGGRSDGLMGGAAQAS